MPWRGTDRQSVRPRHLVLALVLLALTGVLSTLWLPSGRGPTHAAKVVGIDGIALRIGDNGAARPPTALARGVTVGAGDVVLTRPGAKLALRRPGGLSIHVGPATEATWDSADALRVTRGTVYIETETSGSQDPLVIVTHAGRIRHVGTRFGVEVGDRLVRVSVRDGLVRVSGVHEDQDLPAGRLGLLRADGGMSSEPLAPDAGPWNWMQGDDLRFAIEGRPLRDVAAELAAAAGVNLAWPSADSAREAEDLVLHGPALGMDPRAALDAVLLTTHFTLRDAGRDTDGMVILEVARR